LHDEQVGDELEQIWMNSFVGNVKIVSHNLPVPEKKHELRLQWNSQF
jgi:hypothetical protein